MEFLYEHFYKNVLNNLTYNKRYEWLNYINNLILNHSYQDRTVFKYYHYDKFIMSLYRNSKSSEIKRALVIKFKPGQEYLCKESYDKLRGYPMCPNISYTSVFETKKCKLRINTNSKEEYDEYLKNKKCIEPEPNCFYQEILHRDNAYLFIEIEPYSELDLFINHLQNK